MRKILALAGAATALGLVASASAAGAAPLPTLPAPVGIEKPNVELVWWRRVCDRDGDRCWRVWVPENRPLWRDRDHDRDRWRGRDRDDRHRDRDDRR